jgi:hypothetical protein
VTAADFRRIALRLDGAVERAHMRHPDFRVGGKIFATLGYPDEAWGVVMLTPEQQRKLVARARATFLPAKGAWGLRGSTQVLLNRVSAASLKHAIELAWSNRRA